MRTAIKFDKLAACATREEKLKLLVGAAAFEMQKAALSMDVIEVMPSALRLQKGFSVVGPAANEPSITTDMLKNFLWRKLEPQAKAAGMKYATPSDNPILEDLSQVFAQFFHSNMPELDMGWMPLFDMVDLRGSTHDHFDMDDTNAGLSWTQRQPGAATKIRKIISEAKTTVPYLEFSDGLGILDAWLDYNQFWRVDEAIAEFRSTYFDKMASVHYGLLTALSSGVDQAFATDDATTFNNAAGAILRAVRGKGYAVSQNSKFYIVCSPENVGRILRMLEAVRGSQMVAFGTQKQPIAYTVQGVISSTWIASNDTGYYLILPGRKIKRGVWKDVTTEMARNIYTSASDIVGVGRYNAVIGDSEQIKRVLYS